MGFAVPFVCVTNGSIDRLIVLLVFFSSLRLHSTGTLSLSEFRLKKKKKKIAPTHWAIVWLLELCAAGLFPLLGGH